MDTPFVETLLVLPEPNRNRKLEPSEPLFWEVLKGVGVDGVGVIFPFFYAFFPFFLRFSRPSPKGQGQTTANCCKNGEFHSDPVCTDPVQNFPSFRRNQTRNRNRRNRFPGTKTGTVL